MQTNIVSFNAEGDLELAPGYSYAMALHNYAKHYEYIRGRVRLAHKFLTTERLASGTESILKDLIETLDQAMLVPPNER